MSSRVQKGATVFRPVPKARSRAPTATPSSTHTQPPSTPYGPDAAATSTTFPIALAIPSTAVSVREPLKQVQLTHSDHPQPSQTPQSSLLQDVTQETPILLPSTSVPPSVVPSHSPPVLASTSNLSVRPSSAGPVNSSGTRISGPPIMFPLPYQIPESGLPLVPSSSSQQTSLVFPPPAPALTEVANVTPFQQHHFPMPLPPSHSQPQRDTTLSRQRRKQTLFANDSDGEVEDGARSVSPTITPRSRRSRGPSLPPYDSNADPGEDIDPTVVTMATLCSDTGQGRVSSKAAEILSNHAAWKTRNRERRVRMRVMMEAKKYGRTVDEEVDQVDRLNPLAEGEERSANNTASSTNPRTSGADEETGIDYSQHMETSRFNVQVRIGPNGETIIDEDSLVVDRAENEDTSHYTHVIESDHTKFVNSGTYGKRYRGSRWSAEETELFYNALSQYGENYELIAYILPGRDRKSCKNKFKAEDRKNHARINYCLNNRIPVDMKTLERMTGKDFSGPTPEIRAPQPSVPHSRQTQEQESTEDVGTQSKTGTKQVKKRSRSRTGGLEDGVIIIGDVNEVPA